MHIFRYFGITLLGAANVLGSGNLRQGNIGDFNGALYERQASTGLTLATLNVMSAASQTQNRGRYASWSERRRPLLKAALETSADILGFQGAFTAQASALQAGLGMTYNCAGTPGGRNSEVMVLCYKKNAITLDDVETFWLSSTLKQSGSKSWGAEWPPVVQLGQFTMTSTGETFWVINAHFDHESERARMESAEMLLDRLKTTIQGSKTGYDPLVVILGNLNIGPDDDVYHKITGDRYLTDNEDLRSIKPDTFIDIQRSENDDLEAVTHASTKPRTKRAERYYHSKDIVNYILAADNGAFVKGCWRIEKVETVDNVFFKKGEKVQYSDDKMIIAELRKGRE